MKNEAGSGYLSGKRPGKTLPARAFKPPWGKRKAPAFVSKAGTYYGGEGGIRTLEALLTLTRFPVVRPRPS